VDERPPGPLVVLEAAEPVVLISRPPAEHGLLGAAHALCDAERRLSLTRVEHDPRALDDAWLRVARAHHALELEPIRFRDLDPLRRSSHPDPLPLFAVNEEDPFDADGRGSCFGADIEVTAPRGAVT
jgi:hypothetical protein